MTLAGAEYIGINKQHQTNESTFCPYKLNHDINVQHYFNIDTLFVFPWFSGWVSLLHIQKNVRGRSRCAFPSPPISPLLHVIWGQLFYNRHDMTGCTRTCFLKTALRCVYGYGRMNHTTAGQPPQSLLPPHICSFMAP